MTGKRTPGQSWYAQQLKDPRWQRKRLEILNRDEWACVNCGSKDKTLHVNHKRYERGKSPWEYPDSLLETLCEDCHATATVLRRRVMDMLGRLDSETEAQVLGYIEGLAWMHDEGASIRLEGWAHAKGVADAWELGLYLTDAEKDRRIDGADVLLAAAGKNDNVVSASTRLSIMQAFAQSVAKKAGL